MFCELTKCCEIILLPKIVIRLSYDRLWTGPKKPSCCWESRLYFHLFRHLCSI